MKNVAVVIVNWNGKQYLQECLDSLAIQTYANFKTIFVDNGSTDGSFEFVQKNHPGIEIIKLEKNTGFAWANNLGIQKAFEDHSIEFIVTLNNDTKLIPTYLEELVGCASRHPEAGSVQPKVSNYFDQTVIDSTGVLICKDMSAINRGQKETDAGQYAKEEEIFGASASAALYVRTALERVQLSPGEFFDNMYFAYYEDVDLAWRMRLAGFASFYEPKARLWHVHSATGKNFSPFKSFHIHRNQYYNIIKDLPLILMVQALLLMPIRYGLLFSSVLMKKGPSAKLAQNSQKNGIVGIVLKSWIQILKNIPMLLKKRRVVQGLKKISNKEIRKWFKIYKADLKKIIYG